MNTRLTFSSGSSHKEYNVAVVESGDGYLVNFSYGRIGSALATGTKTPSPVSREEAEKIASKLLKSKTSKGYTPSGEAAAIMTVEASKEVVILPQLSNPIDTADAQALLASKNLIGQTKVDGERRLLIFKDGEVTGLNRKGTVVAVDPEVADTLRQVCSELCYDSLTVDGEDLGGEIYLFDVIEMNGNDLRDTPFSQRAKILAEIEDDFSQAHSSERAAKHFSFADSIPLCSAAELNCFIETNAQQGEEGVILRVSTALYSAGRPNSGGDSLKIKFTNDCQVLVTAINEGKRSVQMSVLTDAGDLRNVGSCTIPANANIPPVGSIINVGYLWCISAEGSLIQPVYQRARPDLVDIDCHANQLVYRDESILKRAG